MTTAKPTRSRTIWIWLLIILAVLIAISDLLDAARYMGWLPIAALGDLEFFLPNAQWLGALFSVLLAASWLWVAKLLYDLEQSGRLIVIIIAVLNLFTLFLTLLSGTTFSAIALGVVLNLVALVICLLPSSRAAFGRA